MELRHLLALESVLATGSFTAAAAARHLSQPALWSQIKELESELGFPLFRRSGRGVTPTSACLALRPSLRTTLGDVFELRRIAHEIREGGAAPARIGCASSHVGHFLAGCIQELRASDPQVPFPVIVPVTTASAIETFALGNIDLLVEPRGKPRGMKGVPLYDMDLLAIGPAAHGAELDVRELEGVPVTSLPGDSLVRRMLEEAARKAGVKLRLVYESRDPTALLGLARAGACTTVVTTEHLSREEARRASRLRTGQRYLRTPLWLVWPSEDALSPAARALRDVMRSRARELASA